MAEQPYPGKPMRNHTGDTVFTNPQERPQPAVELDGLHKFLLWVSMVLAIVLPVFFGLQTFGTTDLLPVRYSVDGQVLREGAVWEAIVGLTLLGLGTLAIAILARHPRIFNYPFMLTERNAGRQYKNSAQMMVWVAFGMALTMVVMTGSWLGVISMTWIWVALAVTVGAAVVGIWRMIKLR